MLIITIDCSLYHLVIIVTFVIVVVIIIVLIIIVVIFFVVVVAVIIVVFIIVVIVVIVFVYICQTNTLGQARALETSSGKNLERSTSIEEHSDVLTMYECCNAPGKMKNAITQRNKYQMIDRTHVPRCPPPHSNPVTLTLINLQKIQKLKGGLSQEQRI